MDHEINARFSRLESALEKQADIITAFKAAEAERERQWYKYGLFVVGGIAATLFGVIWNFLPAIIRGNE